MVMKSVHAFLCPARQSFSEQLLRPFHRLKLIVVCLINSAQSAEQPTTNELLQLAEEQDGTRESEVKGEEKRLKDENWARFTEENRKGAGNTMNRG